MEFKKFLNEKLIIIVSILMTFFTLFYFHTGQGYKGILFFIFLFVIWILFIDDVTKPISWIFFIFGTLEAIIFYRIFFGFFLIMIALGAIHARTGLRG